MTAVSERRTGAARVATRRRYLMCPPTYFAVVYAINPWMKPGAPVDPELAVAQWSRLRDLYRKLGHDVQTIEPAPGLPDMVFTANGGLAIGDRALAPRFANAERMPETELFLDWFRAHGYPAAAAASAPNEGEGDFLLVGRRLLAGTGFRSTRGAHAEVASYFDREVITLELVDPRYYHLDTALAVLAEDEIAYLPEAFSPASRGLLAELYPDAVVARPEDATWLGLNAVSDGRNVAVAAQATGFIAQLAERGFTPHPVDMSELRKAGGGAKCCTLELRS